MPDPMWQKTGLCPECGNRLVKGVGRADRVACPACNWIAPDGGVIVAERLAVDLLRLLRESGWEGDDDEVGHQEIDADELERAEVHLSISAAKHLAHLAQTHLTETLEQ